MNKGKNKNREWMMMVSAMSSTSVARMETVFKKDKAHAKSNITRPLNTLLLLLKSKPC